MGAKKRKRAATKTPVRDALEPESELQDSVRDHLGAVERAHLAYIDAAVRGQFADSIDIDAALKKGREQENRWDYLLGHNPSRAVVALEPHTASTGEIDTLIRKRARARDQLASHLRSGKHIERWLWVASGRIDFADTEKTRFKLDQNGIQFVGGMVLAKHLPVARPVAKAKSQRRPVAARAKASRKK